MDTIFKQKITQATRLLAKLRQYVPLMILKSVYCALFDSPMKYSCKIWGQNYKSHIRDLQKIQNEAVNILIFERNSKFKQTL